MEHAMSHAIAAMLAGMLAFAGAPGFAADRMLAPELASRIGADRFEFRGFGKTASGFENMIWRFAADGRLSGEAAMSGRLTRGGMGETFGMKNAGTWRREGESLCLAWDAGNRRFNGCYVVLSGAGGTVYLIGPQILEGKIYRGNEPGPASGAR
jgi:hypothetical protein